MRFLPAPLLILLAMGASRAQTPNPPVKPTTTIDVPVDPGKGGDAGDKPVETARTPAANDPDRVQYGDAIKITVFGQTDLGVELRAPRHGIIKLPMVGRVNVVGKSPLDIADEISEILRKKGLVAAPDVSVYITEYATKRIFIQGAVLTSQMISLSRHERLTLSQAIAMTGGLSDDANRTSIRIIRRPHNAPRPEFLVRDFGRITMADHYKEDLQLLDGDTIVVDTQNRIYVMGWVRRPGAYVLSRIDDSSLLKVLAMAGGFSPGADKDDVVVYLPRPEGGYEKRSGIDVKSMLNKGKIELDFAIPAGSIIFVPETWL